jgi:hypothetical protein
MRLPTARVLGGKIFSATQKQDSAIRYAEKAGHKD